MSKPIQINLRPNERIYINGAVVRVDRRVTLELMNDVTFLLESHVLQPEQTTTTLRQLYFVAQSVLMEPANAAHAVRVFEEMHRATLASFTNDVVVTGQEHPELATTCQQGIPLTVSSAVRMPSPVS